MSDAAARQPETIAGAAARARASARTIGRLSSRNTSVREFWPPGGQRRDTGQQRHGGDGRHGPRQPLGGYKRAQDTAKRPGSHHGRQGRQAGSDAARAQQLRQRDRGGQGRNRSDLRGPGRGQQEARGEAERHPDRRSAAGTATLENAAAPIADNIQRP